MASDHCEVHRDEMAVIHEVSADVKWLKKFGGWWMAVTGGAVVLMVPILISFFVYLSRVETRLSVVEFKLTTHMEKK